MNPTDTQTELVAGEESPVLIDIIIPFYNNLELTQKCIDSIREHTFFSYRLLLINNGSMIVVSVDGLRAHDLIWQNQENLGWCRAVNQGLRRSTAPYVVLMNNDVEVCKHWDSDLISILDHRPKTGAAGPLVASGDQWQQRENVFENFVSTGRIHVVEGKGDCPNYASKGVPMLAFFCTMLKRQVIEEVGLLDEQFENGLCDDDDYCLRMQKAGWNLALSLSTVVEHKHRATFDLLEKGEYERLHKQNWELFRKKWGIKEDTRPKVTIAILNQGSISVGLVPQVMAMVTSKQYNCITYFPSDRPTSHNRNRIVKDFLASDSEWLVMIDEDTTPHGNILDLLKEDKDVVGVPYFMWRPEMLEQNGMALYFNIVNWNVKKNAYDTVALTGAETDFIECDGVGSGCIIIHRRVLEKVKAPFMRMWDEDGLATEGHDFFFCRKVRAKGFKVWAAPVAFYRCSHFKTVDLLDVRISLATIAATKEQNQIPDNPPAMIEEPVDALIELH